MIRRLTIKFYKSDCLSYSINIGSVMHGAIMKIISNEYAEKMHISSIRPFSQKTNFKDGRLVWTVNLLNDEAWENIAQPLLSDLLQEIYLESKDITLAIESKEVSSLSYDELLSRHYLNSGAYRYTELELDSPAAFKADGRYIIFPSSQLILNNLVRRYDYSSENTELSDDSLCELIENNTSIVEYNLKSMKFMLEGIKIPSFIGRITIKTGGPPEFIRLINMLLEYGEYSGMGIKTALGMGSYKIIGKRGML